MIEYNRDGVVISGKTAKNYEVLSYHENGKLRTIENYKNGKRHGEFIRYDKNGQTISQCTYKDGTLLHELLLIIIYITFFPFNFLRQSKIRKL